MGEMSVVTTWSEGLVLSRFCLKQNTVCRSKINNTKNMIKAEKEISHQRECKTNNFE